MNPRAILSATLRWFPWYVAYLLGITAAGGVLGTLAYTALGPLLADSMSLSQLAAKGARNGAYLALVWAPGTAFVLCVIHAHRRNKRAAMTAGKRADLAADGRG